MPPVTGSARGRFVPCWFARLMVESPPTSQSINPAASASASRVSQDLVPGAVPGQAAVPLPHGLPRPELLRHVPPRNSRRGTRRRSRRPPADGREKACPACHPRMASTVRSAAHCASVKARVRDMAPTSPHNHAQLMETRPSGNSWSRPSVPGRTPAGRVLGPGALRCPAPHPGDRGGPAPREDTTPLSLRENIEFNTSCTTASSSPTTFG